MKAMKKVPPDGGWGWSVVFGSAIVNIVFQSMISNFSYLYGQQLVSMGYATSGNTLTVSMLITVLNLCGPFAGSFVKMTSPRTVCFTGCCFGSIGLLLSGFSTKLWHLILTYSVLLGIGLGCIQNSTYTAINNYFISNRGRAVGIAAAGTGVGQVFMPFVCNYLLTNFSFRGTCIILSAISLNGLAGSLLLQPVSKHMITIYDKDEETHLLNGQTKIEIVKRNESRRRQTEPAIHSDVLLNGSSFTKHYSLNSLSASYNNYDLKTNNRAKQDIKQKENFFVDSLKRMAHFMDMDLLKDITFINVLTGIALTITSIMTFSAIFPLFLKNHVKLEMHEIPYCMASVAAADIVGRVTLPTLTDKFEVKAKNAFMISSVFIVISRQLIAYQTNLPALIALSALYGLSRSSIIVQNNIVISDNCKREQVPSAIGLGMLVKALVVLPLMNIIGKLRDYTGSYILCLTVQDIFIVVMFAMWVPEIVFKFIKSRTNRVITTSI